MRERIDAVSVSGSDHTNARTEQGICFVDSTHAPWGAEESLLMLAEELQRRHISVELLCRSPELAQSWRSRIGDTARLRQPLLRKRRLHRLRDALWFAGHYGKIAKHAHVVIFSYHLIAPAVLMRRLLNGRFRLTLDLHDYINPGRGRRLLRRCVSLADTVVAVSDFAAEPVSGTGTPIQVLYRPASPPRITDQPSCQRDPDEYLVVGVIGRLEASKRHDLVIEAIAAMPNLPVRLVIRGSARAEDREYSLRIRELAEYLLPGRVAFDGRVPKSAAYDGLHVVVVANESEAMGRTVAEAQLHGLTVVVPSAGGASELVESGRTGLTFTPCSSTELADRLRLLYENEGQRQHLGRAASIAALQRHHPSRYASRYLEAITS